MGMFGRFTVSLSMLTILFGFAPSAAAQTGPERTTTSSPSPVTWKDEWHTFDWVDASITAIGAGTQLGLEFVHPETRWRGPLWFDESVQERLAASSPEARQRRGRASDVTLGVSLLHATALDPLIARSLHGDDRVGFQMAGVALESMALTGALTSIVKVSVARSRPPPPRCRHRPTASGCPERENRSFFSGHTSLAFAGFSTFAVLHARIPIYGAPWDGLATGAYGAMALSTGLLRIAAHQHYATDVIVGALVGSAIGVTVPLLYMRENRASPNTHSAESIEMAIRPGMGGSGRPRGILSIRW